VAYLGQHLFVILKSLPSSGDLQTHLDAFASSLGTIHQLLKAELHVPAAIGVGAHHPGLEGLSASFHEALGAIELGQQQWSWDGDRIYHINDFGMVAPLLSGVNEQNTGLSHSLLDRLSENDDMVTTLTTFFDHNLSLTATANALGIHRNTLVYRLDRIGELLGLDPRRFSQAAQIKLAILYSRFVGMEP
jgi:carbohydrate diacid regulator